MNARNRMAGPIEARDRLWLLVVSPVVWACHFLLCYATAAVWCGRLGGTGDAFADVRVAITGYTAVAVVAIAVTAYAGHRRHTFGAAQLPHDDDSPEDRYRFIGFATLLLSGVSAIAVVYAALAAVFIETCQ